QVPCVTAKRLADQRRSFCRSAQKRRVGIERNTEESRSVQFLVLSGPRKRAVAVVLMRSLPVELPDGFVVALSGKGSFDFAGASASPTPCSAQHDKGKS